MPVDVEAERPEGCICIRPRREMVDGAMVVTGVYFPGHRLTKSGETGERIVDGLEYCALHGNDRMERAQEIERERLAKVAQERLDRIAAEKDRIAEQSGIPSRFWEFDFDSSPLSQTRSGLVRTLRECIEEESWLLWGVTPGTGKTGLATSYARRLIRNDDPDARGTSILFRHAPDLFTEIRASYNPRDDGPDEAELLHRYSTVGLLVIDDLGKESINGSGWVESRLYQIINRRHGEMRPVFITSNLSPAELGARIGQPTMDRIIEMCGPDNIVEIKGENQRRKR